jgi:ribosomal protein S18 acetylase RimI-like enzyme
VSAAPFDIVRADAWSVQALCDGLSGAFADYITGTLTMPVAEFPAFVTRQGIALGESRVAVRDGGIVAQAFVAPRTACGRWRLASMGALPAARGTGAAAGLLDDVVARAAASGVGAVELECFAANERAIALYRGRGFEPVSTLNGWTRAAGTLLPPAPSRAPSPLAVDAATGIAWLAGIECSIGDLPLQVGPLAIAGAPRPVTCWQQGAAQLVFSIRDDGVVHVHSLVDAHPRQRDAAALVHALCEAHFDAAIHVPELQRDDLGGECFAWAGFERSALSQVLMVRPLR